MKPFRILMNAVGGSPGGGALPTPSDPPAPAPTPTPTVVPTTPPAQGGAPQPDQAARDAQLIKQGRDAAYAELRRSGALKKSYVQATEGRANPPSTPQGNAGAEHDLRRLDRALTRSGHGSKLKSDLAHQRLERAFIDEAPDDIDGWLTEYFGDSGATPAAAAPPPAAAPNNAPPSPAAPTPISNRGAPAAPQVPPEDVNILKMSESDRKALIQQKGLKWYTERLRAQTRGTRVRVK